MPCLKPDDGDEAREDISGQGQQQVGAQQGQAYAHLSHVVCVDRPENTSSYGMNGNTVISILLSNFTKPLHI
jgi:hypothetical protein